MITPEQQGQLTQALDGMKSTNPTLNQGSTGGANDWYSQIKSGGYRPAVTAPAAQTQPFPAQPVAPPTQNFGNQPQSTMSYLPGEISKAASGLGKGIISTAQQVTGAISKTNPLSQYFSQMPAELKQQLTTQHPNIAALLGMSTGDISPALGMIEKGVGAKSGSLTQTDQTPGSTEKVGKAVGEAIPMLATELGGAPIENAAQKLGKGLEETVAKGANKIGDVGNTIISKAKGIATLKPTPEILATPESRLSKLKPEEQKIWLDNKAEQISAQEKLGKEKISTTEKAFQEKIAREAETKANQATQRANDLLKQQEISAQNKTMDLKPKSLKFFGEQSQNYRKLVTDEWAGREKTPIKTDDLKSYIDQVTKDYTGKTDMAKADAIKARLGLTEKVNPLSTKTFGENVPTKLKTDMTLGDIKNQITSLRQEGMSAAARKGARVYTSDEKLTDDAISTLNDYLKNNGVDFKNANNFWRQYAPLRDRMIQEIKPFDTTGIQKTTFGDTLTEVLKNPDSQNKRFINAIEQGLGESVTSEGRNIMSKLDETQKAAITAKYNAEAAKEAAKISTESGKSKLAENISSQSKKLEETRQELARSNFTKKFWKMAIPAIIGGDITLKRLTGLGL